MQSVPAFTTLLNFDTVVFDYQAQDEWKEIHGALDDIFRANGFDSKSTHLDCGDNSATESERFITFYCGSDGRNAILQSYTHLVTVNIQTADDDKKLIQELQEKLTKVLKSNNTKRFPAIKRGGVVDCYIPTVDKRLVEYDFDKTVFEANSKYQHVKIMHSHQYGNMLILDGDPNLAESDLAYTKAITGNDREDFTGKDVLILGGGDGGILHELLQGNVNFVTMVEIDQVVIDAAVKHLRGICYDSMDSLTGDNYEVLVEDCIPILKSYAEQGKTFDYVINDLTAIPITTEPQGSQWDFLRLILDYSMKVLKTTGKYFTQGNGANMTGALAMYEQQLQKLSCKVEFSKETICVPSYMEMWVFYEIWKAPPQKQANNSS